MMRFISFYTHFKREFLRFFTVPQTTIYPPLLVVFFYMLIFGIALGARIQDVAGFPYLAFILPGLVVQNVINGSYSNTSGSVFVSRMLGYISDVLLAPLSYLQTILAYIFAGMLRGLFLGVFTYTISLLFFRTPIQHVWLFLTYMLLISYVFAGMGIVIGLYAKEWQQLNIFVNFVITPLTFLGGVFYSLDMVPTFIATITRSNPLFAMIDGTRFAMLGFGEGNAYLGMLYLGVVGAATTVVCVYLFRIGYRMRT